MAPPSPLALLCVIVSPLSVKDPPSMKNAPPSSSPDVLPVMVEFVIEVDVASESA